MIKRNYIFFFLLITSLLVFISLTYHTHSLSVGDFEVFNVTIINNYPQYSIQKIILVEEIIHVYDNGSILVRQTMILPNISAYLPAGTFIQNANCSKGFFYIARLGYNTSSFIYNGTKDGLYVYYNVSYVLDSKYVFILYFNASGIPVKGCSIKYCCGKVAMKAIYVLWKTNLVSNETLPTFPGYTLAQTMTYNFFSNIEAQSPRTILLGIIVVGLSAIILILLFRPKM